MTSLTDQMIVAIAKARADLAPLLKEEERDERGRFASGGGPNGTFGEGGHGGYSQEAATHEFEAQGKIVDGDLAGAADSYDKAREALKEAGNRAEDRIRLGGEQIHYERGKNITSACHDARNALYTAAGACRKAAETGSDKDKMNAHFAAGAAARAVNHANDMLGRDGRQG